VTQFLPLFSIFTPVKIEGLIFTGVKISLHLATNLVIDLVIDLVINLVFAENPWFAPNFPIYGPLGSQQG
jgi:hypothetical protein